MAISPDTRPPPAPRVPPPDGDGSQGRPDAAPSLDQALAACRDGATLLTVNRRLARDLAGRDERARFESGATWWETPAILPLSSWLERLHDEALTLGLSSRTRLPPLLAERRWHALIERDRAVTLLSPLATAREALRAWQLGHAWHCLPDEDDYLPVDQYHWRRWATAYAEALESEHMIDAATLGAHLIEVIGAGGLALPERVVLAGFLNPTPATRCLMDALATAGVRVGTIVDGAPCTPAPLVWADDACELAGIADAVRLRLDREPGALLGVVIPDLEARRAEVLRAFDRRFFPAMTPAEIERIGRPYDLSLGQPLADVALVRTALLALQLAVGNLEQRDLSTLLLSPYLGFHRSERHERERLDRRLRERRVQGLDLAGLVARLDGSSRLRRRLSALAGEWADEARPGRGGRRSASAWSERFARALDAFGWPEDDLGSEEFQAVQAWRGVLGDLRSLDDGDPLDASAALRLVRHLAAARLFQAETPDLAVRVLGRLESHGQRFDALWVAGLDTERWPPSGSPSPFLPIAAQKEAGMPEASSAARLALARTEFAHWCASAPELVASRAAERDGNPLHWASVLEGLASVVGDTSSADSPGVGPPEPVAPTPAAPMPAAPTPAALVAVAATLEAIDDGMGPPLDAGDAVAGGARLFEDQAACPFRAFASHRLHAQPLEEVAGGIDARQAGTLLHRALELVWRDLHSHAGLLDAIASDTLGERIDAAIDAALEEERVSPDWRELERRRLGPLLHHWLRTQEVPRAPFEVVAFESTRETVHGGVRVTLAIDRMDRLVAPGEPLQGMTDDEAGAAALGGPRLVLDYKSGINNSIDGWEEARVARPQLPLYALTNEEVAGVGYAEVATNACRFRGVVAGEGLLPRVESSAAAWPGHRARWRAALDEVGREVATGHAEVRPSNGACRYCRVRALCRIDVDDATACDDADAEAEEGGAGHGGAERFQ